MPVTQSPSSESSKISISINCARLPRFTILIPNFPSSFKRRIEGEILCALTLSISMLISAVRPSLIMPLGLFICDSTLKVLVSGEALLETNVSFPLMACPVTKST